MGKVERMTRLASEFESAAWVEKHRGIAVMVCASCGARRAYPPEDTQHGAECAIHPPEDTQSSQDFFNAIGQKLKDLERDVQRQAARGRLH